MKISIQTLIATFMFASCAMAMETMKELDLDAKAIHAAVKFDIKTMRTLFKKGIDINAQRPQDGATVLHLVISTEDTSRKHEKSLAMINFLLNETDININGTNSEDTTPLLLALLSDREDIAELLLLSENEINVNIANKRGDSAVKYAHSEGKEHIRQLILAKGGKKVVIGNITLFAQDDDGRSADFMKNGYEAYHRLLGTISDNTHEAALNLAKLYVHDQRRPNEAYHAFFLAIAQNSPSVIKLLIEAGIQFDRPYESERGGTIRSESPVELAAFYGYTDGLQVLQAHEKFIVYIIENKATPEKIQQFKQKGFSVNFRSIGYVNGITKNGASARNATPLHCAIETKNFPVVVALIEAGADVNAKDAQGKTPLNYAAEQESEAIILYLLEKNASLTTAIANNSNTKLAALLLSVAGKFSHK